MLRDPESGQGTVEYALMISLVVIFVISVMIALGPILRNFWGRQMSEKALNEHRANLSSGLYD